MADYKVSIIIPLFNKWELTLQCLQALGGNTGDVACEVVLVDNASTDGTGDYLSALGGDIKVIRNRENLGFAKACNQGAAAASGKYLLFLNNDTIPLKGWIEPLVAELEGDPAIAMVGSKLLYDSGTVQHAGVVYARESRSPYHPYRFASSDAHYVNRRKEINAVTAACALIRRETFRELRGFCEEYRNGYEDLDLCVRIRRAGGKIVYQPRSVLFHLESQSPGRMEHDSANRRLFFEKWKGVLLTDEDAYYTPDGLKIAWFGKNCARVPRIEKIRSAREAEAYGAIGRMELLAAGNRRGEALAILKDADRWPDDFSALRFGGIAADWFGEPSLACPLYERALELEENLDTRVLLVNALANLGNVDRLHAALEESVGRYPGQGIFWLVRGSRSLERGAFREAAKDFEEASFQGAAFRHSLLGEAVAARRAGDPERCFHWCRALAAMDPKDTTALSELREAGRQMKGRPGVAEVLHRYR